MKDLKYTLLLFVFSMTAISCRRTFTQTNSVSGKWNIVYDSTYSGVGSANREVNYCGQAGDYFNFVNDSIIYTKEGSALDTLNYRFTSSNTIIISSFGIILNGVPETSQIINLTSNNLIIVAPVMPTPAGAFGRKVGLSR